MSSVQYVFTVLRNTNYYIIRYYYLVFIRLGNVSIIQQNLETKKTKNKKKFVHTPHGRHGRRCQHVRHSHDTEITTSNSQACNIENIVIVMGNVKFVAVIVFH